MPSPDMAPVRVQRSRAKGWRMPPNTVYVGRPSRWGNPHDWRAWIEDWRACADHRDGDGHDWCRDRATEAFSEDIAEGKLPEIIARIGVLRGKNLACWCALDQPCHADVLLELANAR